MPRTADLARLFSAVAQGDVVRARALAAAIAEGEDRAGKPTAAAALRTALVTRNGPRDLEVSHAAVNVSLAELLTPLPPAQFADLRLPDRKRRVLAEVIAEHRHRAALEAHNLAPRSKLFFYGEPGCGKTFASRALGTELGWPVLVVRFDALLGAFLGQTSLRLREVFRFAASTPCVLVLDEVDAVARMRGQATDIGELDRVVITLMQQLDLVQPAGMVIAASNVPQHLDPALQRRFDVRLDFPRPSGSALRTYARDIASERGVAVLNGARHELAAAKTFAEVEQILLAEHRRSVLRGV